LAYRSGIMPVASTVGPGTRFLVMVLLGPSPLCGGYFASKPKLTFLRPDVTTVQIIFSLNVTKKKEGETIDLQHDPITN
jgi:hypothetical protein